MSQMWIRRPIGGVTRVTLGIVALLVIVGLYAVIAHKQRQVNPKTTAFPGTSQFAEGWQKLQPKRDFPDPVTDRKKWKNYIESSWLLSDCVATFGRLFIGLFWGVLLSLVIGLAMGCFSPIEAFFVPPLSFFARIPATAMLPVYFVAFGTGSQFFTAMIALGIFPTLAQSIYQAAKKDVSEHAIYKAYTLGASQMEVIWNVIVRQILPRLLENIRLQVGPAMVFLIAAEWAMADVGFGYRLRIQQRLLSMNIVYLYLAILGISGLLLDWLLSMLRRRLSPWFGE